MNLRELDREVGLPYWQGVIRDIMLDDRLTVAPQWCAHGQVAPSCPGKRGRGQHGAGHTAGPDCQQLRDLIMNPTFATLDEVIASNDKVYHLWCIRAWVYADIIERKLGWRMYGSGPDSVTFHGPEGMELITLSNKAIMDIICGAKP